MASEFNNGKCNRRNLHDKTVFRWGGINGQFTRTVKAWRDECQVYGFDDSMYQNCSVCGMHFEDDEHIYTGKFTAKPRKYKYRYGFRHMCKACAYRIADKVIEADGSVHTIRE